MLVNLAHSLQLGDDTLHDSVLLLDRLCRGRDATRLASNPVILVAISRLAAQQGEASPRTCSCSCPLHQNSNAQCRGLLQSGK